MPKRHFTDESFANSVRDLIASVYTVDEVFPDKEIFEFAGSNAKPEKVFDRSDLVEWAQAEGPGEIFTDSQLSEWAKDNGYVLAQSEADKAADDNFDEWEKQSK